MSRHAVDPGGADLSWRTQAGDQDQWCAPIEGVMTPWGCIAELTGPQTITTSRQQLCEPGRIIADPPAGHHAPVVTDHR
jgi:hypothetical protein